jgi:hypothetical protein
LFSSSLFFFSSSSVFFSSSNFFFSSLIGSPGAAKKISRWLDKDVIFCMEKIRIHDE